MRKISILLLSFLLILCAILGISACNNSGDDKEITSSDIYKKVNPSVALVSINKLQGSTSGSGFFIDKNGTLVTNYHVIKDGLFGTVQLHNGSKADIGNVLGYDENLNIAVLETKATNTTPIVINQMNSVEVGDKVYAIGYSSSTELESSSSIFSTGMVSSFLSDATLEYIQSNIEITERSSGGVLINSAGKVIGITTAKVNVNGSNHMNLSIPIEEVNNVVLNVNESLEIVTKRHYPVYVNFYVDRNLYHCQKLQYEQMATSISPDKLGYTFDGWYIDENFTTPYDFSQKVLKTFNLYAKFNINNYKVIFNLNSGSWTDSVPDDTWTINNCDTNLPIPSRAGYLFEGWTDGKGNYIDAFPASSNLGDLVFDAHWIEGAEGLTIKGNEIIKYNGTADSINIPLSYRGKSVTKIGTEAFSHCTSLKKIVFTTNISEIGDYAFDGCGNLFEIIIPKSVTTVGIFAFRDCRTVIYCEANTRPEGWNIFWNTTSPVVWDYDNNFIDINGYTYIVSNNIRYRLKDGLATVVMQPLSLAGNIKIPEYINYEDKKYKVTSISAYSFYNCVNLITIEIPKTVLKIETNSFYGCTSLETIILPFVGESRDATAYKGVFGYIFGYTTVEAENVSDFASSSTEFMNKQYGKVENAIWQYTCHNKFGGAAYHYKVQSYHYFIPKSLREVILTDQTIINISSFNGCYMLNNISLNSNIEKIDSYAFYCCTSLKDILIPNTVTLIGESAFFGCNGFTDIVIPNSVTYIGKSAFENCNSIVSLQLPFVGTQKNGGAIYFTNIFGAKPSSSEENKVPASLKKVIVMGGSSICKGAFANCYYITDIVLPDSIITIDIGAFENCKSLKSFNIPKNVKTIGNYAFYGCENITNFSIPNTVETIGNYAFSNCYNLIRIEIGKKVNRIDYNAFLNCYNLKEIVIPNGLRTISNNVFTNCTSLQEIIIPDSVTYIGYGVFKGCTNLIRISIPETITEINNYTFENCINLSEIILPKGITRIGIAAFNNCNALKNIFFEGTSLDWDKIKIEMDNNPFLTAIHLFYSEDNPYLDGSETILYWRYDKDGKTPIIWKKN